MEFIRYHARLLIAIAAGIAIFAILPLDLLHYRGAIAWDCGVWLFLSMITATLINADSKELDSRATKMDVRGYMLFAVMIAAAFMSLYLSLGLMAQAKQQEGWVHNAGFALAIFTVISSWFFVQMMFAVHYTHYYYLHNKKGGGLKFPKEHTDGEEPDFSDFMYFSFVLGMTFQVSDVQVTHRNMRRIALAHGVIAFFFNTFILALSVNIAAGLFQ